MTVIISDVAHYLALTETNNGIYWSVGIHSFLFTSLLDKDGLPRFKYVDLHELSFASTIYFTRGHPLYDTFNMKSSHLLEAGLIKHWTPTTTRNNQKVSRNISLTLDHLSGAFYTLLYGHLLSSIVVVLELCLRSFKKLFCGKEHDKWMSTSNGGFVN